MAPHSSVLAWRIPWMEELGGLQSMGHKESDKECRPGGSTRAPPPGVLQLTDGLMWVCGPGEVRSSDFSNLRDLLICKSMRPNP